VTRIGSHALNFATLLVLGLCFIACGPASPFAPFFDDDGGGSGGGGGGGSDLGFAFQMPEDGSLVDSVITVSVTGDNLAQAIFHFAGDDQFVDDTAPFEWQLDPSDWVLGPYLLRIRGIHQDGRGRSRESIVTLERAVPLQEILDAIDDLPPTHWYEIPNSRLASVGYYDPDDKRGPLSSVIGAASGGAYDSKRDRLVVWGGGDNYSGNEIYVFDMATAAWSRITDPSTFPPGDEDNASKSGSHPDGSPISRHSYDSIEYIPPPVDRFFVGGSSALYNPGSGLRDDTTYYFDFDALTWEIVADDVPSNGFGNITGVDAMGRVWQHGGGDNKALTVWDPATESWTVHAEWPGWFGYEHTGEVDPVRNLFVALGSTVRIWDLENPDDGGSVLLSAVPTELEAALNPGIVYHPPSGKMVAWAGGKTVFTLDVTTGAWTRITSSGDVDPGPQAPRGTFGRWRYVPSRDVFIVVNSITGNVFVYRLP
jgi:hypothetical protein